MPRSLSDPKRAKRVAKIPPCGRVNDYQVPLSPFQKLLDRRREQLGLSWRDIAEAIEKHPSTVWIWAHNRNGYPAPKSCTPSHLVKLAKVLKIDLADLHTALDASRHIFTPRENPVPLNFVSPFETLVEALLQVKTRTVRTAWILDMARRLAPKALPGATKA